MSPSPERPGQNPNNFQSSSLEKNKGVFPATARRLLAPEPSTQTTPRPPVEFPKQPETKKPLSKKALIARIAGTLAVVAGVGYAATHPEKINDLASDARLQIAQLVMEKGPLIQEKINDIAGKNNVPEVFDSTAKTINIQAGVNTEYVDPNIPLVDHNGKKLIFFPVLLKEGQQATSTVRESTGITTRTYADGRVETIRNGFAGYELTVREAGTEFIVTPDMQDARLFINGGGTGVIINGQRVYSSITLRWTAENGSYYFLSLYPSDIVMQVQLTDISKDAPIIGKDYKNLMKELLEKEGGKPVHGGQSILKTAFNYARVKIDLFTLNADGSGGNGSILFGFKTITDNNGVEKLALVK